ncbi:MAG: hypothetical protein NVS3B20_08870 [Polyangiales bacterium]
MRTLRLCTLVAIGLGVSAGCSSSKSADGGALGGGDATLFDSAPADTFVAETVVETLPDAVTKDGPSGSDSIGGGETDTGPTCPKDVHPGDLCDMIKQDCADPAETCAYDTTLFHSVCRKNPLGTAAKGEFCDPKNPCDRGLFCIASHCAPACCPGDNSVCGAASGTKGECSLSITGATGSGKDAVNFHVCGYSNVCHPFKYDCPSGEVCLYASDPDVFKCSTPSTAGMVDAKPGTVCKYVNDCGESQSCFAFKADAGPTDYKCYVFCWLKAPDGFMVGSKPGGRFPADGTCTVGGTSYGTCTAVAGIGGGLGICLGK